jgi:hypothetical protein
MAEVSPGKPGGWSFSSTQKVAVRPKMSKTSPSISTLYYFHLVKARAYNNTVSEKKIGKTNFQEGSRESARAKRR